MVNTDWAIEAGIKIPQERIAQEKMPGNPYRNFVAVDAKDAKAPWVKALVDNYQQTNVCDHASDRLSQCDAAGMRRRAAG